MIPLHYQTPENALRPQRPSKGRPYLVGGIVAVVGAYFTWIALLICWPNWRWQILDLPDMNYCAMVGMGISVCISAVPYQLFANSGQPRRVHFCSGLAGALFIMATTNFMQRADDAGDTRLGSPVVGIAFMLTILIAIPALLGVLSRYPKQGSENEGGALKIEVGK